MVATAHDEILCDNEKEKTLAACNRVHESHKTQERCLNGRSYGKRLAKEVFYNIYKRLEKKTDRAITPAAKAVCVPEHLSSPGSLQVKQLHHLHAQLSLGQN